MFEFAVTVRSPAAPPPRRGELKVPAALVPLKVMSCVAANITAVPPCKCSSDPALVDEGGACRGSGTRGQVGADEPVDLNDDVLRIEQQAAALPAWMLPSSSTDLPLTSIWPPSPGAPPAASRFAPDFDVVDARRLGDDAAARTRAVALQP